MKTTIPTIDTNHLYIVNISEQKVVNIITFLSTDTDDSFEQRAEDVCEQYSETYPNAWFEIYTSEDLYNDSISPELG
jgi:hypothetical protein